MDDIVSRPTSVDDESDEELGAWIYGFSRAARARASEATKTAESTGNQNEALNGAIRDASASNESDADPDQTNGTHDTWTSGKKRAIPIKGSDGAVPQKRARTREGFTTIAIYGGTNVKHGANVTPKGLSSHEECPNQARKGVCKKRYRKHCSYEGCSSLAINGGVCYAHGAKRPTCSQKGCSNVAIEGGVCIRHGAKRRTCSQEGCSNKAVNGGVCFAHGAKRKICSREGCSKVAKKGGVCYAHGAKRAKRPTCSHDGCSNLSIKGGVCTRHGAKRPACSHDGCSNGALKGGVCIRHGAKCRRKVCSHDGCSTISVQGGVCIRHGAKRRTCSQEGCSNRVVEGGVCVRHGAKPSWLMHQHHRR